MFSAEERAAGDELVFEDEEAAPLAKRIRTVSFERPISWQGLPERPRTPANDTSGVSRYALACPFYRRDPQKYERCLSSSWLGSIEDVKQHLLRGHRRPDFYCARCYKTFDSAERRDNHTRHTDCDRLPRPGLEGIGDDQRRELSKHTSRRKSVEAQWYDIWDVVFPGARRDPPQSVYVGSPMQESAQLLRSFWDDRRSEILGSVSLPQHLDTTLINGIIQRTLDRIEDAVGSVLPKQREAPDDDDDWPSFAMSDPVILTSSSLPKSASSYRTTPAVSPPSSPLSLYSARSRAGLFGPRKRQSAAAAAAEEDAFHNVPLFVPSSQASSGVLEAAELDALDDFGSHSYPLPGLEGEDDIFGTASAAEAGYELAYLPVD